MGQIQEKGCGFWKCADLRQTEHMASSLDGLKKMD